MTLEDAAKLQRCDRNDAAATGLEDRYPTVGVMTGPFDVRRVIHETRRSPDSLAYVSP
jgi:hypothetical protein